jgi:hypothetical protein
LLAVIGEGNRNSKVRDWNSLACFVGGGVHWGWGKVSLEAQFLPIFFHGEGWELGKNSTLNQNKNK